MPIDGNVADGTRAFRLSQESRTMRQSQCSHPATISRHVPRSCLCHALCVSGALSLSPPIVDSCPIPCLLPRYEVGTVDTRYLHEGGPCSCLDLDRISILQKTKHHNPLNTLLSLRCGCPVLQSHFHHHAFVPSHGFCPICSLSMPSSMLAPPLAKASAGSTPAIPVLYRPISSFVR